MLQTKRRLQIATSLTIATLIVAVGVLGAFTATDRLRQMLEHQVAEDSQVINENLRIIISQATREYTFCIRESSEVIIANAKRVLDDAWAQV